MQDDSRLVRSDEMSFGDRVRLYRMRAGLTQEEAGGLVGVSTSMWKKWESGARSVPTFSRLVDIAGVLRLRDLAALTGQPYAVSADGGREHPALPAVRAALEHHPALLPAGDPVDLDGLDRRITVAWDAVASPGPWRWATAGTVLPDAVRDSERAMRTSADRRRAALLACRVYLLARAWLKWVGHAADLSPLAADRGMAAAELSGDPGAYAAGAWNIAQSMSTRALAEDARTVAADARTMLAADARMESAPPSLVAAWGALHLIEAIAAARDDDRGAVRELLRGADWAAARTGDEVNWWRLAFGPTNVAIHRVAVSVELGQSRAAVRGAAGVLADRSPSAERRVAHRLDLAQSHVRLREDEAALAVLGEAEQISPEQVLWSVTARAGVTEMLRRESGRTRPLLRPLASRLGVVA